MDPLVILQVCPRGGDMHPAARLFLERSFFQCLRWRQASCRTCLQPGAGASRTRVCLLGRLLQCGFPVRPISAVATSILPHLGKPVLGSCFANHICPPKLRVQRAMHKCNTLLQVALCGSCPAIRRFNHVRRCSWNTQER